jgi:hypothetical protein
MADLGVEPPMTGDLDERCAGHVFHREAGLVDAGRHLGRLGRILLGVPTGREYRVGVEPSEDTSGSPLARPCCGQSACAKLPSHAD